MKRDERDPSERPLKRLHKGMKIMLWYRSEVLQMRRWITCQPFQSTSSPCTFCPGSIQSLSCHDSNPEILDQFSGGLLTSRISWAPITIRDIFSLGQTDADVSPSTKSHHTHLYPLEIPWRDTLNWVRLEKALTSSASRLFYEEPHHTCGLQPPFRGSW